MAYQRGTLDPSLINYLTDFKYLIYKPIKTLVTTYKCVIKGTLLNKMPTVICVAKNFILSLGRHLYNKQTWLQIHTFHAKHPVVFISSVERVRVKSQSSTNTFTSNYPPCLIHLPNPIWSLWGLFWFLCEVSEPNKQSERAAVLVSSGSAALYHQPIRGLFLHTLVVNYYQPAAIMSAASTCSYMCSSNIT